MPPSPGSSSTTPRVAPVAEGPVQRWARTLNAVDALRARAFATRNPVLLQQVYLPGPLLEADTALLSRLVPPGCGLTGARTRYTDVRVRTRGDRVWVTATAALPPSQLICGGRARATAPGAGPSRLRLELATTSRGPRIAVQVLDSG